MTELWKKLLAYIVLTLRSLQRMHDTPHSIAGGVAFGILFSFTPLFFCRALLAIALAWIFRCSKVAAAIAVNLHELIFFLWPLVYREEYRIGFWLLSSPHRFPPKIYKGLNLEHLHWVILRETVENWEKIGWPWLLGSLVLGIPTAIACFIITLKVVEHYQAKHPRPRIIG